jgi:hypothetical protein
MEKLLILRATTTAFGTWLQRTTNMDLKLGQEIATEDGAITLYPSDWAHPPPRPGVFKIDGVPRGQEGSFKDSDAAISFEVLTLDTERIEVHVKCHQQAASPYYTALLIRIEETWTNLAGQEHVSSGTNAAVKQVDAGLQRRKGGPVPTSEETRAQIVRGWLQAQSQGIKQQRYCEQNEIGESTLRRWMREMQAKGQLSS